MLASSGGWDEALHRAEAAESNLAGATGAHGGRTTSGGPKAAASTASTRDVSSEVLRLIQQQGTSGPFRSMSSRGHRGLGVVAELGMSAMAHPMSAAETLELWDAVLSA